MTLRMTNDQSPMTNECPIRRIFGPPFNANLSIDQTLNPKGIPQQSPGLRGTSYPGIMRSIGNNPEGVVADHNGNATRPQPRWGCKTSCPLTQGSSFLATLGFV